MNNKICVYAICKNESKFVDKWYESMKEADCIVVLDTGSTDDTVEKLRSHGVYVESKIINPWRFDVARNESLKLVPEDCNILVCTDLDEVFEAGWAEKVRNTWKEDTLCCYYTFFWSHTDSGEDGNIFIYSKIHSRNDWYWDYPVHELLIKKRETLSIEDMSTKDRELTKEEFESRTINLINKVKLHHYPDTQKSRASYLDLIKLRCSENKDGHDPYSRIYLIREYLNYLSYDECITAVKETLETYSKDYSTLELSWMYLCLGQCYFYGKQEKQKAIFALQKAIELETNFRDPYILLGYVYIDLMQYEFAINYLKQALRNTRRFYTFLESGNGAPWSWEIYNMLSFCYLNIGQNLKALAYVAKALSFDPENESLKKDFKQCLELAKDSDFSRGD